MRPTDKISSLIGKLKLNASADLDNRIDNTISKALAEQNKTTTAATQPNIWRTIMKGKLLKLAAAAVIMVCAVLVLQLAGGPDMASTAWAKVSMQMAEVDYVHFLFMAEPQHYRKIAPREGWYGYGTVVHRGWSGRTSYDNGQTRKLFDRHNTELAVKPSIIKEQNFFAWISDGLLADDSEQLRKQVPTSVGGDFLIYNFVPTTEKARNIGQYVERVSVTVGRYSLLPVQMKMTFKQNTGIDHIDAFQGGYALLIFDYDSPVKSAEFFEPPTTSEPPHGSSEIAVGQGEREIEIFDSPGIEKAIVSLYGDDSKEDHIFADVAFIVEGGIRSITIRKIRLEVNDPQSIGVGDVENWPDKRYRNISGTLMLRPADENSKYIVEISCWLDTIREGDMN